MDAELVDTILKTGQDPKKITKKVIIDLVARIQAHAGDPKYKKIGEKLEEIKEQYEQGLFYSIEFLKALLELAKETAQVEKEVIPEEEIDKGRNALTELFNGIKTEQHQLSKQELLTILIQLLKELDLMVGKILFKAKKRLKKTKKNYLDQISN